MDNGVDFKKPKPTKNLKDSETQVQKERQFQVFHHAVIMMVAMVMAVSVSHARIYKDLWFIDV